MKSTKYLVTALGFSKTVTEKSSNNALTGHLCAGNKGKQRESVSYTISHHFRRSETHTN